MAVQPAYPTDVKVYIDGDDITFRIFGVDTIELSDVNNLFHDIDITPYIRSPGRHKLTITSVSGVGRVEARVSLR